MKLRRIARPSGKGRNKRLSLLKTEMEKYIRSPSRIDLFVKFSLCVFIKSVDAFKRSNVARLIIYLLLFFLPI